MRAVETSNSGRATSNRCLLMNIGLLDWFELQRDQTNCYWVTETLFLNHRWFTICLKCATRTQV